MPDVRCYIEQEGKPADPVEELNFANFADLGRESLHCCEDLTEKGANANFGRGGTFEAGIAFRNEEARYEDCAAQRERGDNTKDPELCIAKDGHDVGKIDIAR